MLTDAQRRELYAALEDNLGAAPAASLMNEIALMGQLDWRDVARRSDIDNLRTDLRGEITAVRGEMAELRVELKGDIGALRAEMAELRVELKGEMAELRSELHSEVADLRAEIKGLVARQLIASVPLAFGVAGLVLAAAKLV